MREKGVVVVVCGGGGGGGDVPENDVCFRSSVLNMKITVKKQPTNGK